MCLTKGKDTPFLSGVQLVINAENKMSLKASHVPYGATWKWLFLPHFDITKIVTF